MTTEPLAAGTGGDPPTHDTAPPPPGDEAAPVGEIPPFAPPQPGLPDSDPADAEAVEAEGGPDLDGVPDVQMDGDEGGGVAPPEPEMDLELLLMDNRDRLADLGNKGVVLGDQHPMVTQLLNTALLESILTAVGGRALVVQTLLSVHREVSALIDRAEEQVRQAQLLAPPNRADRRRGR